MPWRVSNTGGNVPPRVIRTDDYQFDGVASIVERMRSRFARIAPSTAHWELLSVLAANS